MSIKGVIDVFNMELTPCEFSLLMRIADSRSDDTLFYPDWDRVLEQTGFTREQVNRMLTGLLEDGLIGVTGTMLLPVITRTQRSVGIRIGPRTERRATDEPPLQPRPLLPRRGYIYLIHGLGTPWYKIGRSVSPEVRQSQLGTKGPFKHDLFHVLEVDDMATAEQMLHAHFEDVKAEGEWFKLTASDVEWICSLDCSTVAELQREIEARYGTG